MKHNKYFDPFQDLYAMMDECNDTGNKLLLKKIEEIITLLERSGVPISPYINTLCNIANNYKKHDSSYFTSTITDTLMKYGNSIVEQNESTIDNYIYGLKETENNNEKRLVNKVRKIRKETKGLRQQSTDATLRALFKATIATSILCAGISFGPSAAKKMATERYAIEKDVDTGEEQRIDVTKRDFHGKKYVREYGDVQVDRTTAEYYRMVLDYYYTDEVQDDSIKESYKYKYREDLAKAKGKVGKDLTMFNAKVERVSNVDEPSRIVRGTQIQELTEDRYKKTLLILEIMYWSTSLSLIASSVFDLLSYKDYLDAKAKLNDAIREYDEYMDEREKRKSNKLKLTKRLFMD